MAKLSLPLLLLLLLVATATAGRTPTLVFLLAGQSNMGGRGGATSGNGKTWDGVVPPECAPSQRILRLSPDLRWEEAREPLHAGIDVHNVLGIGPGMPFAHAVLASRAVPPDTVIGLVPCAQGGTPIANWSRSTELYDRMVTRGRAAMATVGHGGEARPKLGALLWYQGEADTIRREDAEVYAPRMEAMVRDVRRDLALPELLVIQVGIATGQGKFVDLVRDAQKAVKLPNLKYVDAKGLPIANDYTHLTTAAQVTLGKMLAKAYLATL
ncbi:hypothetical protein GUJ93_ZPchr0003g18333 [Zizania palustris]|uniref:Sialate O-acetylesterase domain-containing protein n=1 Tax=Zizania palustris TaxID=103762 RepID=A0A8J5V640_ZIZPA|nr:hypothetical protein GUJ93_ZPchr0003g17255 [Zizania palustris]KAG8061892.1 hypothetical protein GUJ93_ZPchr0003g18333 [Zizania palustris]